MKKKEILIIFVLLFGVLLGLLANLGPRPVLIQPEKDNTDIPLIITFKFRYFPTIFFGPIVISGKPTGIYYTDSGERVQSIGGGGILLGNISFIRPERPLEPNRRIKLRFTVEKDLRLSQRFTLPLWRDYYNYYFMPQEGLQPFPEDEAIQEFLEGLKQRPLQEDEVRIQIQEILKGLKAEGMPKKIPYDELQLGRDNFLENLAEEAKKWRPDAELYAVRTIGPDAATYSYIFASDGSPNWLVVTTGGVQPAPAYTFIDEQRKTELKDVLTRTSFSLPAKKDLQPLPTEIVPSNIAEFHQVWTQAAAQITKKGYESRLKAYGIYEIILTYPETETPLWTLNYYHVYPGTDEWTDDHLTCVIDPQSNTVISCAVEKGGFPDPTANWKTYRNEEYGFEMKYPPTWIKEEDRDYEGREYILFRTPERLLFGAPAPISKIEIEPLSGRSLADYVEDKVLACKMWLRVGEEDIWGLRRKEQKTTDAGVKYFDVVCIDASAEYGEIRHIYFKHKDQVISLIFFGFSETLTDVIINSFFFEM